MLATACRNAPLLSAVQSDAAVITPNGDGVDDVAHISYTVGTDANVSILLKDDSGKTYTFRDKELRSAGVYDAPFDGVTPIDDGKATRRVMPNGKYQYFVIAEDMAGHRSELGGQIEIRDADSNPVQIQNMVVSLTGGSDASSSTPTISPNGDGVADELMVGYGTNKDAEVVMFATNKDGTVLLMDQRQKRSPALYSHFWDGTYNGSPLPDGPYKIHIQAFDASGNVSEEIRDVIVKGSGKPELLITSVDFSPVAVPVGGNINVTIRVKNTGDTPISTLGPAPGTPYRTDQTFNYWTEADGATPKYFERPGKWRVAVSYNLAGSPYPIRWGLFADENRQLMPGEETTVTGTITVLPRTRELRFWASVEQGGVGFPGGEVGLKTIIVDY
jgi:hypothetical protein